MPFHPKKHSREGDLLFDFSPPGIYSSPEFATIQGYFTLTDFLGHLIQS